MNPNLRPTPPTDPYEAQYAALDIERALIRQQLAANLVPSQNGLPPEQVAKIELARILGEAEADNARQANEGHITQADRYARNKAAWQVLQEGLDPTPEREAQAYMTARGLTSAPGSQYSKLKKELDPTMPGWLFAGIGRVEVPRVTDTLVYFIGRIGAQHAVDLWGPTKFISAKKFANNPTLLLDIAERGDPTAQYLRPGKRPEGFVQYFRRKGLRRPDSLKEFRYAEQDPHDPTLPLIRVVGDTAAQSDYTQGRIEHRKAYIEMRQRLLGRELRGGQHDWLATMHEITNDYKKQLGRLEGVYKKTHRVDLGRFFRASEERSRLVAINTLRNTTHMTAANLMQTLQDHRDLVEANLTGLTDILANGQSPMVPVLDQDDRTIVLDIENVIENAFEDTGYDATWDRRGFDIAQVRRLLPSRSTPYETERAELVRAALYKTIAEKAEKLASYGNNRAAEQMLKQFKKIGILHGYAYDAIKVMTDYAYIHHWRQVQANRTQPGRAHAYFSGSHLPPMRQDAAKIPPQGNRNRKALSTRESDLAIQIIVDGVVEDQLVTVHSRHRGPNKVDDLLRITSSMHDERAAAAFRNFFTPPQPKKPNIIHRVRRRLNGSRNSPPTVPQP